MKKPLSKQIQALQSLVQSTIAKENLIVDNLLHSPDELLTPGQRISDKVAKFGGSWAFIIYFFVVLFLWIAINSFLPASKIFDPYPFILMNLILSCIAAIQAPIIMMSQNRQEEKDRQRSENDYLINLKAEMEIQTLNQKVDLLIEEQIKLLFEIQEKQMAILQKIEKKLNA